MSLSPDTLSTLLTTVVSVGIISGLLYLYGMVLVWVHITPGDWPGRIIFAALFGLLAYDLLLVTGLPGLR